MKVIEFQHCLDEETLAETVRVLKEAGIPYQISSGQPSFDVSSLGSSSQTANQRIIISIAPEDYPRARETVEAEALLVELPKNHHLHSASPDELQEILREADDWSPFDVAHARRILEEKGITLEDPEDLAKIRIEILKKGKRAPLTLFALSAILPILGIITSITLLSIIGCGIALSVTFMKSKTLEGRYPTYDRRSRNLGLLFSILATGIALAGFYIWGRFISYGDYDLYVP